MTGDLVVEKYDFICPNQTRFDQTSLTCNHADLVDCSISEDLFDIVPFGEKEAPAFTDEYEA